MDDFGVLVESIGFKAHGRSSAPMADLKGKTNVNNGVSRNFGISSGFDAKPSSTSKSKSAYNSNLVDGSFIGDLDGIFQSSNSQKTQNYGGFDGFDDVFGGPTKNSNTALDLDSIFKGSNNFESNPSAWNTHDNDDIFSGMPGLKSSSASGNNDDVFGTMKQSAPVDDLLGNFGGMGLKSNVSRRNSGNVAKNAPAPKFDDLIPGFGVSSPPNNGANSERSWPRQSSGHSAKSTPTSAEDPFVVLETSSSRSSSSSGFFSDQFQEDTAKKSVPSAIDELENFAKGTMHSNANEQPEVLFADVEASRDKKRYQRGARNSENDLESFFSKGAQQTTKPRPSAPTVDPMFDVLFQNRGPKKEQTSTETFSGTKKAPSVTNITDDFSFMFGAPPSEAFQEIEGESEERRRARLNHHLRTQARVAKALADKNERDFQTQQDQEERHRLSDTLDDDIKRWAAGKEGNLRALLSSLQSVLWPECGWQQVSLTDLITSVSVKRVYYKATLCVHPDKVQQKGATIRQKYIAEKVFDLLKEAWNKFNSEEL